jgi:hypothetical protein
MLRQIRNQVRRLTEKEEAEEIEMIEETVETEVAVKEETEDLLVNNQHLKKNSYLCGPSGKKDFLNNRCHVTTKKNKIQETT